MILSNCTDFQTVSGKLMEIVSFREAEKVHISYEKSEERMNF